MVKGRRKKKKKEKVLKSLVQAAKGTPLSIGRKEAIAAKRTVQDLQQVPDASKISAEDRPKGKDGDPISDSELNAQLNEQFPDRKQGEIDPLSPEVQAERAKKQTGTLVNGKIIDFSGKDIRDMRRFANATPEQLQKFKEQGAVSQDVSDRIQKQQEIPTTDAEILAASETGGEIPKARELADTGVQAFEGLELPGTDKGLIQTLGDTPLGQAFAGKATLKNLRKEGQLDNIVEMTDFMLDNGLTPEQITNDPHIQMFLKLQLNELDVKLIKQGEQDISFLAQLVEGLPVIGGIARKHFGGAITPTIAAQRVDDLASNIQQMGNTVRDYRMAAARTPANKDVYLELLEETEIEIKNAESRMKLLIIQSPTLQNSPEEVETLQSKTNRALNRIGDARNAMILGETLEQAMAQTAQEQTL